MAKKSVSRAVTPEVIDVPPPNPEVALALSDGDPIQQFVAGLQMFFGEALELEKRANDDLAVAKTWTVPTCLEDDQRLVAALRQNTVERKVIEEKWGVTQIIHRFHRRLTAMRDRGVTVRTEVERIGNRLHNQYTEAERRRAQEEQERERRAAEERARLDRERVLAEIDAQALAAEQASPDLSEREKRFVDYYTGPYASSASRAAQQAGYKNPDQAAAKLLAASKITQAIEAARKAKEIRDQATAIRQSPVIVDDVVEVKAQVAGGDRTTWGYECYNPDAFIAAVLDPLERTKHGIPVDIAQEALRRMLKDGAPILTDYAKALKENLDRWPGMRHKKNTKVV